MAPFKWVTSDLTGFSCLADVKAYQCNVNDTTPLSTLLDEISQAECHRT